MAHETNSSNQSTFYFANAAAGLMWPAVAEATIGHLRREAEIGAPSAAAEAQETLTQGYLAAAKLIGAAVNEVAFVESGNRALAALIQSAELQPGDHVLVDRTCWGGTLDMLASFPDAVIDVMPVDANGRVDVERARRNADPATKLILLTWCPATCGIFNPAEEVGALAAELGAFYIVDACQVVGQRPVDVTKLRCHGLAASGRKWLRGPRGTALLFASSEYLQATSPFMADQIGRPRSDARRYETGESYVAGRVGLSVALRTALEMGDDVIARHLCANAQSIRDRLSDVPGLTIVEQGQDLASFITAIVAGFSAAEVAAMLARDGLSVSAPSRAYAPLDMDARGLNDVIRIAPQIFTTSAGVDKLIKGLKGLGAALPA